MSSDRILDLNEPRTVQHSTSQAFRQKDCYNNKMQETNNKANIPQKHLADPSVSNTLSKQRCETAETGQGSSPKGRKGKNARKKEMLKNLNIPTPNNLPHIAQPSQSLSGHLGQHNVSPLQDLFMKQIIPMYASTNSRYLENLLHHPQFQFAQFQYSVQSYQIQQMGYGNQFRGNTSILNNNLHTTSAPNTPLQNPNQRTTGSVPNSPATQSEPSSPRYMENVMQHPLLSQTLKNNSSKNMEQNALLNSIERIQINAVNKDPTADNSSPRHKRKNKKKIDNNIDRLFDPYLSEEEVDAQLTDNIFIEGVLRINPKQFQMAYVSSSDRNEQDILIDGMKNRNRALEGDVVVVQLIESDGEDNDENKQKKGKIVFIKEQVHNRTCIGTLKLMQDKNRQKALFVPRDNRIPRLNIPFTSWPDNFYQNAKAYENTLFLAKILDWTDTRFALGKIVCNIGQSGDMVSETKAILAQTDLDITPFGPEVRHLFPRLDYTIPEEELAKREDCRNLCLFSIDPFNCRDIDDAVTCKQLHNGNYEIGVHIADVAHFLTENTPLDEKVAEKATTIYMVERAYHMLPDELCMLCSLFPGVDKLAFSVFWEITKDAKVLSHRFAKTVINSCCQLAYEHAQSILEDKEDSEANFPETYNGFTYDNIHQSIKVLGSIAAILRNRRFANGALRIDQPKVSFGLNPVNGLPENFWIYENKESHQLIEEFMLLANMTVAARIREDHPKLAFLRSHPPPSGYMMKQLANSLKPMGINLNISSAGDLHNSLLPHVGPDCKDKGKVMVLNLLCAKPMARAKYFCADGVDDEDFQHYALNVPLYTHFTSPIRRYADIMVHRLLSASLNYRDAPNWEVDKVRMVAANCNKQKYNAKKAGELSTELYTLKYIEMHSPMETDAAVVDVREKFIDVIVIAMGLNRRIFFNNDFPGKFNCVKHEGGMRLSKMEVTWESVNGSPEVEQVIEVFSILRVELSRDDDMVKIETKLVRPRQSTPIKSN